MSRSGPKTVSQADLLESQPTLTSDVFDLDQGLTIKANAFATPDDRAAVWLRGCATA
jgi:hypothetical protein